MCHAFWRTLNVHSYTASHIIIWQHSRGEKDISNCMLVPLQQGRDETLQKFSTLVLFFITATAFMIDLEYVSPLFLQIIPREFSVTS